MEKILSVAEYEAAMPVIPQEDLRPEIEKRTQAKRDFSIIVLDDDPTGTQTVHGIPVLTQWSAEVIEQELNRESALFFIMTNSRSLTADKAKELALEIGKNIGIASRKTGKETLVISRSDSTLRGHYPIEVEGLLEASGNESAIRFIIPAFFEGGRITVEDVHYVREKEVFLPAAQTPYAKDSVFGYSHSNLKQYVEEKTDGKVKASEVVSLSIQAFREESVEQLIQRLRGIPAGSTCIVNAADAYDLQKFVLALLDSGISAMCRTAASFVSAISALPPKDLIGPKILEKKPGKGKLVVVGSHVPKSTAQLAHLQQQEKLNSFELLLDELLPAEKAAEKIDLLIEQMNQALQRDETVLIYTQRTLIEADSDEQNLFISEQVSALVCKIVSGLAQAPRFIVAKGGITSSDVATKSLGIKRAMVLGQIFPGVPIWEAGPKSKFPGLPYVVFPGNVGEEDTLSKTLFPT